MNTEIPLSELQKDIHNALKSWHNSRADSSSLDSLQLFRQARVGGSANVRRASNKIILDALETLALEDEISASLLQQHFLDGALMHAVASRLNIGQSTAYRRQQKAIRQLALIIQAKEAQARAVYQASLEKRLRLPPEAQLFGIEEQLYSLLERLIVADTPWLVSIEGLGGIGKTALANAGVRHSELINRFHHIVWVSAKQRAFFPGIGLEGETSPALTVEGLIDSLLEEFGHSAALAQPPQEKRVTLIRLLKEAPHLVVIDNLETVADYQTLLPVLWEITNPSKVLLTSRYSLRAYPNVFCLALASLNKTDTLALIRHEANTRGLPMLANAADAELERIYEVVGGNPLALKLVVGQTAFLPLSQVLDNLKEAGGRSIADLYTHIYWQAWQMLDDTSQQTLLVMPLVQDGTLNQLLSLSRLKTAELHRALKQLITLSLVLVEGDLEERRYSVHRLTETFLLNEAIVWQSSA
jgi:hypothetical protein